MCAVFEFHLRSTKKRLATLAYNSKGEFLEDVTSNAVIRNRVLGGNGNLRPVKLVQSPKKRKEMKRRTATTGDGVGAPKKKITYVNFISNILLKKNYDAQLA